MKITIEKTQLLQSLQVATKTLDSKSVLAIGAQAILTATDRLTIQTFASGIYFTTKVNADIQETGSTVIYLSMLQNAIDKMPSSDIILLQTKDDTLEIASTTAKIHHKIRTTYTKKIPDPPVMTPQATIKMPLARLKQAILFTKDFASKDTNRYFITGVFFEYDETTHALQLIATDARTLSFFNTTSNSNNLEYEQGTSPHGKIVPIKALEILLLLDQSLDDETATITFDDAHASINVASTTIITNLIDGIYPQYKKITIRDKHEHHAQVNIADLENAIKIVSVAQGAGDSDKTLLIIATDSITVKNDTTLAVDIAESQSTIPCKSETPIELCFYTKTLRNITNTLRHDGSELILSFTEKLEKVTFDAGDTKHFVISMPMSPSAQHSTK